MITLLAKRFIKNHQQADSPEVRRAYGFLCGIVGICFNLLLFGGKLFAGVLSGSIAITADAFNNLSDAGSSVVSLLGFKLAAQKPDEEHPFGHGRFEYIAGFVVSMIILLMGFQLAASSLDKIRHPAPVEVGILPVIILILSILVKVYMAVYNRRIGKKIQSVTMKATSLDSLSDAVSTAAVLLSMGLMWGWGINADGWFGMLVAVFILYTGIKSAKETIDPLLGQSPDPALVRRIEETALDTPAVVGVHDLIIHDYGPGRMMISLHAEVPADGDMLALHDEIDLLERRLQKEYRCHTVIHMDPIITNDAHINEIRTQTEGKLREIDPVLTLHDFRMVAGPTHTNLIFDITAPFDFRLSDKALRQEVSDKVSQLNPDFFAVVTVDKSYLG